MKVGVLGVGTITSAVIHGFIQSGKLDDCKKPFLDQVALSPRNSEKVKSIVESQRLCPKAIGNVIMATTNQEVLDKSDFVIVGVHHKMLKEIFQDLNFKPDHTIISITAVITQKELHEATKNVVSMDKIFRVCTLPAVKNCKGSSILYPPNPVVKDLFSKIGFCMECETEKKYNVACKPCCLMGDFYNRCRVTKNWLIDNGIESKSAVAYTANVMAAILDDAVNRCNEEEHIFEDLIAEQTPGGLNEKIMKELEAKGTYEELKAAMERL